MTDAVVEFGINTSRFKRDLDTIKRDARRTAVSIERSFRRAEGRGFGVDPRVARTQRLATEREINQRMLVDRRQSLEQMIRAEGQARSRMENRTRVFAQRQRESMGKAEQSGSRYARSMVMMGTAVGASAMLVRGASRAYRQYAEDNRWAASATEDLTRSLGRLGDAVGRTLAIGAAGGGGSLISKTIDGSVGVYENLQDYFVSVVHGRETANALRGNIGRIERQDRAIAQGQIFRREKLKMQARGEGPEAEAARKELEKEAYVSRLNAMAESGKLTGSQVSALASMQRRGVGTTGVGDQRALLDVARMSTETTAAEMRNRGLVFEADVFSTRAQAELDRQRIDPRLSPDRQRMLSDAISARRDARIAGLTARRAEQKQEQEQEREQRRQRVLERYRFSAEESRIDGIAAGGETKRAERLRVELRLRKEILEVNRNDALLQGDRTRIIEGLTSRASDEIERIRMRRDSVAVRTIGTGVGDALIRRQTLGGGMGIANQQLAESKKQTALQEELVDKIGVYA